MHMTCCARAPCMHVADYAPTQVLQPLFLFDATNTLSPYFFPHGCKVSTHETLSSVSVQVRA